MKEKAIRKETIGSIENVTLMEFGEGQINMRFIENRDGDFEGDGICFKATEPRPIGEQPDAPETNTDDWEPDLIMTFSKSESIDVVIRHLEAFRKEYF